MKFGFCTPPTPSVPLFTVHVSLSQPCRTKATPTAALYCAGSLALLSLCWCLVTQYMTQHNWDRAVPSVGTQPSDGATPPVSPPRPRHLKVPCPDHQRSPLRSPPRRTPRPPTQTRLAVPECATAKQATPLRVGRCKTCSTLPPLVSTCSNVGYCFQVTVSDRIPPSSFSPPRLFSLSLSFSPFLGCRRRSTPEPRGMRVLLFLKKGGRGGHIVPK